MKSFKRSASLFPMVITGMLILIFGNLLILDYLVVQNIQSKPFVLGETTTASCPSACLTAINNITGGTGATTKEYFVPLGAGSNDTDQWVDVAGLQASIDTTQYRRIKKAVFEATIQVPTGNQLVYVRLFNTTDKHPVWFSELSMSGNGPILLTAPITLDTGNKLYQVQMKTQLKFTANLTQSRIRITTY